MTKNEKKELEAILNHYLIYNNKTNEYTLIKPNQVSYEPVKLHLSKALTKFINRVQLREEKGGEQAPPTEWRALFPLWQ